MRYPILEDMSKEQIRIQLSGGYVGISSFFEVTKHNGCVSLIIPGSSFTRIKLSSLL